MEINRRALRASLGTRTSRREGTKTRRNRTATGVKRERPRVRLAALIEEMRTKG